jgi:hypothetical protein
VSKTFSKKNDKKIDVGFIAFSGVSQRWEFKNTTKKRFLSKNRAEKFLQKNRQKSQTEFLSILFTHVLGHFSVRRSKKHRKNIENNKSDPGPFLA